MLELYGLEAAQEKNIISESFDNVGKSFQQILNDLEAVNRSEGGLSAVDALSLQQSLFQYSFYQETVTKIASKAANSINEVMKAQ
jgi:hypothetical protein